MGMLEYLGGRIASAVGGQFSLTDTLDPSGGPAIVEGQLPEQFPVGIGMMPYQVSEDIVQAEGVEGIQLHYRGSFTEVMDLRDRIFDDLQGLHSISVSDALTIEQVYRSSSTSLGFDANLRLNWSDNYYVHHWAPSTHRL